MHSGRRTFLGTALAGGAFALAGGRAAAQVGLHDMLRAAIALGRRLRRGEITPLDWQDAIGPTLQSCPADAIWDALRVEEVRRRVPALRRGASIVRVPLYEQLGAEEGGVMRLFFFEAGRGDPPHCHFNQVTAHMVLSGRFRVRHYERLREDPGGFVLRPSRDRVIGVGDVTSISELRDNAHWHHALTRGVLLDVEQGRLDPSIPIRRREMVDLEGTPLADGAIVAPRIERARALRLYG